MLEEAAPHMVDEDLQSPASYLTVRPGDRVYDLYGWAAGHVDEPRIVPSRDEFFDGLVVEGDEARDPLALGQRRPVRPREVLVHPVRRAHGPPLRLSLVRAVAEGLGGRQQVHAHVRLREVVADRQTSLEEQPRTTR